MQRLFAKNVAIPLDAALMEASKEMTDHTVELLLSRWLIRCWLCKSMARPAFCLGSNTEVSETLESTDTTFSSSESNLSVGFAL